MTDIAVAVGTIGGRKNRTSEKRKLALVSLPVVDVDVDVDLASRRDRRGTLCKSSAEVYQHQRHPSPSPIPCIHTASSFYFCVSRFYGLFPEMTHFAFLLATENAALER